MWLNLVLENRPVIIQWAARSVLFFTYESRGACVTGYSYWAGPGRAGPITNLNYVLAKYIKMIVKYTPSVHLNQPTDEVFWHVTQSL